MKPASRILIRGTNWIGDSVMSLAALRELRRLFPEAHLALLVKSWVAALFENQGLVDEIIEIEEQGSRLRRIRQLPQTIRRFDVGLLFQNAFEAALLLWLAGIPLRIGYRTDARRFLLTRSSRPRIREPRRHQTYYYLDLLYQSGLSAHDYLNDPDFKPDIRLRVASPARRRARQLLQQAGARMDHPLVLINPGAHYGPAKRWLTRRYAALADRLIRDRGAEIALIGSSGERPLAAEVSAQMQARPRVLTGRTDLLTLMGLLKECHLLITNDSGPMHLAAALDTPLLALFGSTDEVATGPLSVSARVIHKHVECSPCLLRECPIDFRCFRRIEVEEVFQAAAAVLPGS